MPDAPSDADRIRNKRIAKLGGPASIVPSPSPAGPSVASATSSPSSPTPIKPTNSQSSTPKKHIIEASSVSSMQLRDDYAHSRPRPNPRPAAVFENVESWQHKVLGHICRVTLEKEQTHDAQGNQLTHLPSLRAELVEEGNPLWFTIANLEQVLREGASSQSCDTVLTWLLSCWSRAVEAWRCATPVDKENGARARVLKETRRLTFDYVMLAVNLPEMFDMDVWQANPLAKHMLNDSDGGRELWHGFLAEAVARFRDGVEAEDDDIKTALVGAVEQLSQELSGMSMRDNFQPYVQALRSCCRYPEIVVALSKSTKFLPSKINAPQLESQTLLGPFFRLSPLQAEVATSYFTDPHALNRTQTQIAQNAIRTTLSTHQDVLFDVVDRFIRAPDARPIMLDWLAATVNMNHMRRAIRFDTNQVSSDGFMNNVTVVLDRLCDPFMDSSFTKIDRIDIDYLRRKPRVDICDETKINADKTTSDAFYSVKVDGEDTFISQCFFLTVAAHHYGTEAIHGRLTQLQKDIKWMERELERFAKEIHKYAHNERQLAVFEAAVEKYRENVKIARCSVLAILGVLVDETNQRRAMQFMRYVIVWLLRIVNPGYPQEPLKLPLPAQQPDAFACLPEYFLWDIVDNFKFITRMMPQIAQPTQCRELISICLTFLRNSAYIKNPYLKSGLVTILYYGTIQFYNKDKGVLGNLLFETGFATDNLLHALMQFYIECESTGADTQFYDKFNIRYEIFQVIKCVWESHVYREQLAAEARVNLDFFVRFVNLLLNDVTFVLDESFSAFKRIHELTNQLRESASTLDESSRKQKEDALEEAKARAKSYMGLANETVAMLKLFTEALGDSFTVPEIVQRLADMLDYNLDALVGPKQTELKVENPQEYGFNAKSMLCEIIDVYLNLRDKESFRLAIARDGRSYKPGNFSKATAIIRRFGLKSAAQIELWEQLSVQVEEAKAADEQDEADLGDIPAEFLDPLMADIMKDPVTLPISRETVDRAVIQSYLLSKPQDPFNREPLKIEDVIPNTELKEKIEKFKAERKAQKKVQAQPLDYESVDMM